MRIWRYCKTMFILVFGVFLISVSWIVYQIYCFKAEQNACTILEAEKYPGSLGPRCLALLISSDGEETPSFSFSEIKKGRLYIPIVYAHVGVQGGGNLDQEAWDHLRAFHYLKHIEISSCTVEPNLNADFSGFSKLEFLAIINTPFSAINIGTLSELPLLSEAIFCRKVGINEWIPLISKMKHLKSLELDGDISDEAAQSLANLQSLESLNLKSKYLTSNVAQTLAKMKNLNSLLLIGTLIDDEGLRHLTALKNLKSIVIAESNCISDDGLNFLSAFENLVVLRLESNLITSKSVSTLRQLKNLKILSLSNTRIDDEGFRQLSTLVNLGVLYLSGTDIYDVGEELRFPNLAILTLDNTRLTDKGIRCLSRLPNLRSLSIGNTLVTNESIEILADMPKLTKVYVYNTLIDTDSEEWLQLIRTLENRRLLLAPVSNPPN